MSIIFTNISTLEADFIFVSTFYILQHVWFAYLFACCCCSFLPETEEVQRQKGLTCPFFTDVPVTINLSSGLNRHEVLRNKKKKWILQNPLSLLIREVYYISSSTERNLQMSVESEAALQWFFFLHHTF